MKPKTSPEPLYTFKTEDYYIVIVPRTPFAQAKTDIEARAKGMSLAQYFRDELLGIMTFGEEV